MHRGNSVRSRLDEIEPIQAGLDPVQRHPLREGSHDRLATFHGRVCLFESWLLGNPSTRLKFANSNGHQILQVGQRIVEPQRIDASTTVPLLVCDRHAERDGCFEVATVINSPILMAVGYGNREQTASRSKPMAARDTSPSGQTLNPPGKSPELRGSAACGTVVGTEVHRCCLGRFSSRLNHWRMRSLDSRFSPRYQP